MIVVLRVSSLIFWREEDFLEQRVASSEEGCHAEWESNAVKGDNDETQVCSQCEELIGFFPAAREGTLVVWIAG